MDTLGEKKPFCWEKHHLSLYQKYKKFINDFDIGEHIDFKNITEKNPCGECHSLLDEPYQHYRAKRKIFDLFANSPDYLVFTELHAKDRALSVFDIGPREYQFDILVVNVRNLLAFFQYVDNNGMGMGGEKGAEASGALTRQQEVIRMEHDIIFAIELDGNNKHSWKKDTLRDRFFLETYGVVTQRYTVVDLVPMHHRRKGGRGGTGSSRRHMANFDRTLVFEPTLANIGVNDVIMDVMSTYNKRYSAVAAYNHAKTTTPKKRMGRLGNKPLP